MKLGDFTCGRDNNFNLIRFLAAIGVLVSHAYPLSLGRGTAEPLSTTLGISLGTLCVYIFFAISGLLITQSWINSNSFLRWVSARVLRIIPGLAVVLILTVLVLGPITTSQTQAEYWADASIYSYVPRNLILFDIQYDLPGVFAETPYSEIVNGSIWTLRFEALCYTAIAVLGLSGAFRSPVIAAVCISLWIGFAFLWVLTAETIVVPFNLFYFCYFSLPFATGCALFVVRRHVPLNVTVALALVFLLFVTRGTTWFTLTLPLAVSYSVAYLAYVPSGALMRFNAIGDYSYGFYIYAFPSQQFVAWLIPGVSPLKNMLVAFVITLTFAVLSWHVVERPSLRIKERFAQRAV